LGRYSPTLTNEAPSPTRSRAMTELAPGVSICSQTRLPKYGIQNWYVVVRLLLDRYGGGGSAGHKRIPRRSCAPQRQTAQGAYARLTSGTRGRAQCRLQQARHPVPRPGARTFRSREPGGMIKQRMPNHPMPKLLYRAVSTRARHTRSTRRCARGMRSVASREVSSTRHGHCERDLSYWRESDSACLICGDVHHHVALVSG
jgi:hypothetical protein